MWHVETFYEAKDVSHVSQKEEQKRAWNNIEIANVIV
jgi:hypothetical protein